MAFWGVELKPGKPFRQIPTEGTGSQLHLSNAVLGLNPKHGERTVVKCKVGDNPEIFLASLTGGSVESTSLDIIIADDVIFSVTGSTSVHLTGYYMPIEPQDDTDDEFDDYGEADFDEDDSEEYDEFYGSDEDESEDDKEEEGLVTHGNRGVTIEEITDDAAARALPVLRAKPIVTETLEESESTEEDEDGFERHHKRKTHTIAVAAEEPPAKKQAVENNVKTEATQVGSGSVKKPSKKQEPAASVISVSAGEVTPNVKAEKKKESATPAVSEKKRKAEKTPGAKTEKGLNGAEAATTEQKPKGAKSANGAAEKKPQEKRTVTSQMKKPAAAAVEDEKRVDAGGKKKQAGNPPEEGKSPKVGKGGKGTVREFPNGLKIEELAMGRPDAKRAEKGKKIGMQYVGKLAKNGKVFDQSIGKPFSFRLGTGEVISGWDKGIEGMRVGDKRRLTIPPSMGYGARGAPPDIPGNATLLFDVELVNVK